MASYLKIVKIISEKDVERMGWVVTWCSVPVFSWRDWSKS